MNYKTYEKDHRLLIIWLQNGFSRSNPFEISFLSSSSRQTEFFHWPKCLVFIGQLFPKFYGKLARDASPNIIVTFFMTRRSLFAMHDSKPMMQDWQ